MKQMVCDFNTAHTVSAEMEHAAGWIRVEPQAPQIFRQASELHFCSWYCVSRYAHHEALLNGTMKQEGRA